MAGDIGADLTTYLKTVSGVTDIVGTGTAARIYEEDPKQAVALPYVVFEVLAGSSSSHLGGMAGVAVARVQVDAYAATRPAAFALAEQLKFVLAACRGVTWGSTFVHDEHGNDSYERGRDRPVAGGNQRRYWFSRDYVFSYSEATS
jgi:hypothetical protein